MEILDDLQEKPLKPTNRRRSANFLMYSIICMMLAGVLGYSDLEEYPFFYYLGIIILVGVFICNIIGVFFAIKSFIAKENLTFFKVVLLVVHLCILGVFTKVMFNVYTIMNEIEAYENYGKEMEMDVEEDVDVDVEVDSER